MDEIIRQQLYEIGKETGVTFSYNYMGGGNEYRAIEMGSGKPPYWTIECDGIPNLRALVAWARVLNTTIENIELEGGHEVILDTGMTYDDRSFIVVTIRPQLKRGKSMKKGSKSNPARRVNRKS